MLAIDQLYTATVWSIFSPWEVSEGISAHFSSYLKVPPLDKEIYINSKCARLEVDIQNWNCNKKLGELVSFFNSSLGLKSLPMSCAICSSNTFTLCYTNLWYNKTAQQWTYSTIGSSPFWKLIWNFMSLLPTPQKNISRNFQTLTEWKANIL